MTQPSMGARTSRASWYAALLDRSNSGNTRNRAVGRWVAPLVLAAVVLQIAYPLVHGHARDRLTVLIVITAGAAVLVHATITAGAHVSAVLLGVAGFGWVAEIVGVHTGIPFGRYAYADSLGPRAFGVPVLIGIAWVMMSWPAALVARRLARRRIARMLIGAWALAAWDLFLDPQMVAAGHWSWTNPNPHLPGVDAVPISNFVGWLIVSLVVSIAIQLTAPELAAGSDVAMIAFYLWTYVASVLALAAFLDLPAAAAWGALGMGVIALPLLPRLRAGAQP